MGNNPTRQLHTRLGKSVTVEKMKKRNEIEQKRFQRRKNKKYERLKIKFYVPQMD